MKILMTLLFIVPYITGLCLLFREAMWARELRKKIEEIMEEENDKE